MGLCLRCSVAVRCAGRAHAETIKRTRVTTWLSCRRNLIQQHLSIQKVPIEDYKAAKYNAIRPSPSHSPKVFARRFRIDLEPLHKSRAAAATYSACDYFAGYNVDDATQLGPVMVLETLRTYAEFYSLLLGLRAKRIISLLKSAEPRSYIDYR